MRRAKDILNNLPDAITLVLPKSASRNSRYSSSAHSSRSVSERFLFQPHHKIKKESTIDLLTPPCKYIWSSDCFLIQLLPKELWCIQILLSFGTLGLESVGSGDGSRTDSLLSFTSAVATVMEQEHVRFDHLLSIVTTSLRSLCDAMKGDVLFTEQLEDVAKAISHNRVPKLWQVIIYKI